MIEIECEICFDEEGSYACIRSSHKLIPLPVAIVVTRGEKEHVVKIEGHEVGVSKTNFDACFHANILNRVILNAYKQGCEDTRRIVKEEFER